MSTGFGNRRPAERKPYVAPDELEAVATTPRPLSGILFGLAIIACIGGGYFATMKSRGLGFDLRSYLNVSQPGMEGSNADVPLDRVHNGCKARSDFVSFDAARSRGPNDANAVHAGDAALNTAATYISCLTSEQPERFCNWKHRTHLISALKDYYRLMARVREDRIMMTGGPMAAARNSLVGSPGREGSIVHTDDRVVHGLRALLLDGYLTRQDLSPVLHPLTDLEQALQGVEPRRQGCT